MSEFRGLSARPQPLFPFNAPDTGWRKLALITTTYPVTGQSVVLEWHPLIRRVGNHIMTAALARRITDPVTVTGTTFFTATYSPASTSFASPYQYFGRPITDTYAMDSYSVKIQSGASNITVGLGLFYHWDNTIYVGSQSASANNLALVPTAWTMYGRAVVLQYQSYGYTEDPFPDMNNLPGTAYTP